MPESPNDETILRWRKLGGALYDTRFTGNPNSVADAYNSVAMMEQTIRHVIKVLREDPALLVPALVLELAMDDEKTTAAIMAAMETWATQAIGMLVDDEVLREH